MKLLKPSWVSHNGKLVQESGGPSWSFVVGGGELNRRAVVAETCLTCLSLNDLSNNY